MASRRALRTAVTLAGGVVGVVASAAVWLQAARTPATGVVPDRQLLDQYCVTCHSARLATGGLVLENVDVSRVAANAAIWEKVVGKVRSGQMPPAGRPRPDAQRGEAFVSTLEAALDRAAAAAPNPGRPVVHRLNRTEYANAVRDV